jgi:hypothetical protein
VGEEEKVVMEGGEKADPSVGKVEGERVGCEWVGGLVGDAVCREGSLDGDRVEREDGR